MWNVESKTASLNSSPLECPCVRYMRTSCLLCWNRVWVPRSTDPLLESKTQVEQMSNGSKNRIKNVTRTPPRASWVYSGRGLALVRGLLFTMSRDTHVASRYIALRPSRRGPSLRGACALDCETTSDRALALDRARVRTADRCDPD